MYYPATLIPHEDGSYDVMFVDLPGCISQGKDLEDAIRQGSEALGLHLSGMMEDGQKLPAPSSLEEARQFNENDNEAREVAPLPPGTLWQYILANMPEEKPRTVTLSISLKSAVVERIDGMAEELGLTRSALIAVAAQDYINRARA